MSTDTPKPRRTIDSWLPNPVTQAQWENDRVYVLGAIDLGHHTTATRFGEQLIGLARAQTLGGLLKASPETALFKLNIAIEIFEALSELPGGKPNVLQENISRELTERQAKAADLSRSSVEVYAGSSGRVDPRQAAGGPGGVRAPVIDTGGPVRAAL